MGGGTGEPSSESPAKTTLVEEVVKDLHAAHRLRSFTLLDLSLLHTRTPLSHNCHNKFSFESQPLHGTDGSREHCRQNTPHARMCPCIFNVRTSHCMAQDELRMCVCVSSGCAFLKTKHSISLSSRVVSLPAARFFHIHAHFNLIFLGLTSILILEHRTAVR